MDNGDLLATMYGYFRGDIKGQGRSILIRSTDKGKNWHYVSTIAYLGQAGRGYGCVEPMMIRTGTNRFLAMIRTWKKGYDHEPIYQVLSTDGGTTWSKPTEAANHGVDPDLVMTDDGILVCSFGRPGIFVMCSADGQGRAWTEPTQIYKESNGNHSTCYTGMVKIGPNRILLTHDIVTHKEAGDDKLYDYIFVVPLTIERAR
jgi:hypothetical protein